MSERRSYPAAENPGYLIQVLEFIQDSPFPKPLATRLTKRYKNKFPILYSIMIQNHLTSDYFQLLEMLELCKTTEKTNTWYIFEFSESIKDFTNFPEGHVKSEIIDASKEFKIEEEIQAYEVTEQALNLLSKKNQKIDFLLAYFYKFFRLEPPYFRFFIQHPSVMNISTTRKSEIQNVIFLIVKEKFPWFSKDDAVRILGWAQYFRVLRKTRIEGQERYFFSLVTIVQYIGHTLAHYLNEKCRKVTHLVWHGLEADLYRDLFYYESFLRLESLLELLLDQNPGKYRWGIIERGPGRYRGFRGDPSRQFLQIKETPLQYSYKPEHASRVVKR